MLRYAVPISMIISLCSTWALADIALTIEDVKHDPIFGLAKEDTTIVVELGKDAYRVSQKTIKEGDIVRFVVHNYTHKQHSFTVGSQLSSSHPTIQESPTSPQKSELAVPAFPPGRGTLAPTGERHDHKKVPEAKELPGHMHDFPEKGAKGLPLVRNLSDEPSVFIPAGGKRELLVRINVDTQVQFACLVETHQTSHLSGTLPVMD